MYPPDRMSLLDGARLAAMLVLIHVSTALDGAILWLTPARPASSAPDGESPGTGSHSGSFAEGQDDAGPLSSLRNVCG